MSCAMRGNSGRLIDSVLGVGDRATTKCNSLISNGVGGHLLIRNGTVRHLLSFPPRTQIQNHRKRYPIPASACLTVSTQRGGLSARKLKSAPATSLSR